MLLKAVSSMRESKPPFRIGPSVIRILVVCHRAPPIPKNNKPCIFREMSAELGTRHRVGDESQVFAIKCGETDCLRHMS